MRETQDVSDGIARLQAGDERALAGLYDRYTPLLYRVALRILGRTADAEDVIQQVWLQVWRTSRRYDPARGSVAAWLLNVARSRALDRGRSLASRKRAEDAAAPKDAPSPDPVSNLEASQRHRRVRDALESLEPTQRRVLELAYFEGLSQTEIAERIKAPLGTVKSWARRGLLRLRELIPEEDA